MPTVITSERMTKQIESIAREMLKEELTLIATNNLNNTVTLQLMLGEEQVGNEVTLDINWKVDHGHGGGSYVTGLEARVRQPEEMT